MKHHFLHFLKVVRQQFTGDVNKFITSGCWMTKVMICNFSHKIGGMFFET